MLLQEHFKGSSLAEVNSMAASAAADALDLLEMSSQMCALSGKAVQAKWEFV